MFFGKTKSTISNDALKLNGGVIEMVNSWKYLGFYLLNSNGSLNFDPREELKSFYRASNCMINALHKPSEEVLMRLYFSNCVSVLTYGLEVKEYLARDMRSIHVAMNDGIRKIFGWNRWESIRELRSSFGYRDIYAMAESRRKGFTSSFRLLNNPILTHLKQNSHLF